MRYSVTPVGIIFHCRSWDWADIITKRLDRRTLENERNPPLTAPLLNPADELDCEDHPLVLVDCSCSLEGFEIFTYNSIDVSPLQ